MTTIARSHPRSPRRRRGLSLVEVMISLAIGALLLTAISAAFVGAGQAVQADEQFFSATQQARLAIAVMTAEVRRGSGVDNTVTSTYFRVDHADQSYREFRFVAPTATRPGQVTSYNSKTNQTHVLANNVSNAVFLPKVSQVIVNSVPVNVPVEISIVMTVAVGHNQVTLSGCACPRAYVIYY